MPNYQNGYIYKLWSLQTEKIYIGSSTTIPAKRLNEHKSQYKRFLQMKDKSYLTSFEIVKYPHCKIEIIEKYPCNSKAELDKREGEHQRATKCCNRNIAGRTKKEWNKDNEEKMKKHKKEYYKNNINKNKEYNKEYYKNNKDKFYLHNKKYREKKKKEKIKIKLELDELYNVLTGEDDIPILEAISKLQSLLD